MAANHGATTLLIAGDDLGTVLACLTLSDPSRTVAWPVTRRDGDAAGVVSVVRRRAAAFGLMAVLPGSVSDRSVCAETAMLLAAAEAAIDEGCSVVIWPASLGDDLDALAEALERLRHVGALAALDARAAGADAPRIETPFLDYTATGMEALAGELRAPAGV